MPVLPQGKQSHSDIHTFMTVFFISLATIIGTGILGLPVTLHIAGFYPFTVVFTLAMIAQVGLVVAMVELLQRAQHQARMNAESTPLLVDEVTGQPTTPSAENADERKLFTLQDRKGNTYGSFKVSHPRLESSAPAAEGDDSGPDNANDLTREISILDLDEDLHKDIIDAHYERHYETPSIVHIAEMYMSNPIALGIFHAGAILGFISILTSYGLAGPQAYWQLIHSTSGEINIHSATPPHFLIAIFIVGAAVVVTTALDLIMPILSAGTAVKCSLFIVVIGIVVTIAQHNPIQFTNDWSAVIEPFLLGTVALGGCVNVMPVTYSLLPKKPSKKQISNYRLAVCLAIVICWVLNLLWCRGILMEVPQQSTIDPETGFLTPSLEYAYTHGQISTVPLTLLLRSSKGSHIGKIVEKLVNIFITISITISFLVMSSGLVHMLDGFAISIRNMFGFVSSIVPRISLYLFWFGLVLTFALMNPRSLIQDMSIFASLGQNLQSGLFIIFMLWSSRFGPFAKKYPVHESSMIAPLTPSTIWFIIISAGLVCGAVVIFDIVLPLL